MTIFGLLWWKPPDIWPRNQSHLSSCSSGVTARSNSTRRAVPTNKQPHDRDEAYIVASGSGTFRRGDERVPFQQGDFLFAAAGVPHRFEEFTEDFQTWLIFFGSAGGVA